MTRRMRCFSIAMLGVVLSTSTSAVSTAHAMPREDVARAERLFEEGIALKQSGKFAQACPKLEESQRLDPGLGTQYHLADCWERQGRTASAWLLFDEIARQAAVSGQREREQIARERHTELGPRVPRLNIVVPVSSDVSGLSVWRDGAPLERAHWNAALPVDPGSHEIVARVRERTWRAVVVCDARGRTEMITVPDLGLLSATRLSSASLSPFERVERPSRPRTSHVVGIGLGLLGALAIGAAVTHYAQQ